MDLLLNDIIELTSPYANTWEHVQGPGGNTSVKAGEQMLIKASGYTFKNVVEGRGIVLIDNEQVKVDLANCPPDLLEGKPPHLLQSIPSGLKPSMEFEFHAILKSYVLHTHSVYVNTIVSSGDCEQILRAVFSDLDYILVPYVTPGHPLAEYIYHDVIENGNTMVYFLKNHGIIVNADSQVEVIKTYDDIQRRILSLLDTGKINITDITLKSEDTEYAIELKELYYPLTIEDIRDNIMFPDQSIFFRGQISDNDSGAKVYYDNRDKKVHLKGSSSFIESALGMLYMISFIKEQHKRLGLHAEFIPKNAVDLLHGLNSEKYRRSIL